MSAPPRLIILSVAIGLAAASTPGAAQTATPAPTYSAAERSALQAVQAAINAKNWTAAGSALPAAVAAARSPDALYALGRFQLETGLGLNDVAIQAQGLDNLIASGRVPAADLPTIYRNQGVLANNAGNKAKAESAFAKVAELLPSDPDALINLAQVKNDLRKPKEAVQLISRAIDMKGAAGQRADESWYKYALKLAWDGRSDPALRQSALALSRKLTAAYPTGENRRDALIIFREARPIDAASDVDLLRLMRASGGLAGERDWYDLADGLYKAGNYGEAKAVLDDGAAKRMIDPSKAAWVELIRLNDSRLAGDRASLAGEEARARSQGDARLAMRIADAWYGYGENEKAIALYRLALGRSGADYGLANMRLAMALLAAGRRSEAETAFRAVTGPRAGLAALWLDWLSAPR